MRYVPGTHLSIAATPEIIQQLWRRSLMDVILRSKQFTCRFIDPAQIDYVAKTLTATMSWTTDRDTSPFDPPLALWDFRDLDEIYMRFLSYLGKLGSPYVAEKYGTETLIWLGMVYQDRLKRFSGNSHYPSEFDFNDLTHSRKLSEFVEAGSAFFEIAANPRYRSASDRALMLGMAHSFGTWVNVLAWVQVNEFAEQAVIKDKTLQP